MAMQVIWDLCNDSQINFLHNKNSTNPADWWKKSLLEFNTYSEQSSITKKVYKDVGLDIGKITHYRTFSVQKGGFDGLTPTEITTFTKHLLDKLHKAYMPEMNRHALEVMSGQKDGWWVPRGLINLLHDIEYYEMLLLPKLGEWRAQQQSQGGDKSTCAELFLYHTIPYLVRVLVQDGIYWVRNFLQHPISELLKVSD
jgi:hypothetical protein